MDLLKQSIEQVYGAKFVKVDEPICRTCGGTKSNREQVEKDLIERLYVHGIYVADQLKSKKVPCDNEFHYM